MLGCEISADPLNPLAADHARRAGPITPTGLLSILERAYRRAVIQHSAQRRKSGEPYIIHPLAVAQILADLGMGPLVVAAGLLHDTVEDTDYTLDRVPRGIRRHGGRSGGRRHQAASKLEVRRSTLRPETIRKTGGGDEPRRARAGGRVVADRVHDARAPGGT